MAFPRGASARLAAVAKAFLAQSQHRTAYYLTLNNLMGAAAGILFWLLLARVARLDAALVGVGYTVVALGTVVAVVAKGGLDTALLLKVPGTGRAEGRRLLAFAVAFAAGVAVLLTGALASAAFALGLLQDLDGPGWVFVGAIAALLAATWLQDAYFVALGQAKRAFQRNAVLAMARLLLPLPILLLAFAHPVPLTWGLALAAAALVGVAHSRTVPDRAGRRVPRTEFLRSAARNASGGAAEFLPGLLLAPLVLALEGPESAAYFGIAWTAASLVFQTSGVIGRSALAQMVQAGPQGTASAIRKGAAQNAWVAAPLALAVGLLAPLLLGVFGPAYAREGAVALAILCASTLAVAPVALYLALLRSRDRGSWLLVAFPLALVGLLFWVAPALGARYGLVGIAMAWALANAPFGLFAAWRLRREVVLAAQAGPPVAPREPAGSAEREPSALAPPHAAAMGQPPTPTAPTDPA
jgi:O-antigen/teichoic acid export membrane protein